MHRHNMIPFEITVSHVNGSFAFAGNVDHHQNDDLWRIMFATMTAYACAAAQTLGAPVKSSFDGFSLIITSEIHDRKVFTKVPQGMDHEETEDITRFIGEAFLSLIENTNPRG